MFRYKGSLFRLSELEREFFEVGRMYRVIVAKRKRPLYVTLVASHCGRHLLESRLVMGNFYYWFTDGEVDRKVWAVPQGREPRTFFIEELYDAGFIPTEGDEEYKNWLFNEFVEDLRNG